MPLPTAALNVVVYAPATLAADGAPPAPDFWVPEAAARRRRATCRAPPPLFTRAADRAARGGSAAATWDAATWAAMADEQPLPARPRWAHVEEKISEGHYRLMTTRNTSSPTEYDFVGGDFDAALVEYRPKSPQIACFRACGAPWDAIRVGVARRGTYFFCLGSFGTRGGVGGVTISLSTCTDTTDTIKSSPSLSTQSLQVQVCARAACALRALPRKRARCLRSCAPRGSSGYILVFGQLFSGLFLFPSAQLRLISNCLGPF